MINSTSDKKSVLSRLFNLCKQSLYRPGLQTELQREASLHPNIYPYIRIYYEAVYSLVITKAFVSQDQQIVNIYQQLAKAQTVINRQHPDSVKLKHYLRLCRLKPRAVYLIQVSRYYREFQQAEARISKYRRSTLPEYRALEDPQTIRQRIQPKPKAFSAFLDYYCRLQPRDQADVCRHLRKRYSVAVKVEQRLQHNYQTVTELRKRTALP